MYVFLIIQTRSYYLYCYFSSDWKICNKSEKKGKKKFLRYA
jgi:hypothetical protein